MLRRHGERIDRKNLADDRRIRNGRIHLSVAILFKWLEQHLALVKFNGLIKMLGEIVNYKISLWQSVGLTGLRVPIKAPAGFGYLIGAEMLVQVG